MLTISIGENESSKYWLSVLNELKNRGVKDILIICADGLTAVSYTHLKFTNWDFILYRSKVYLLFQLEICLQYQLFQRQISGNPDRRLYSDRGKNA